MRKRLEYWQEVRSVVVDVSIGRRAVEGMLQTFPCKSFVSEITVVQNAFARKNSHRIVETDILIIVHTMHDDTQIVFASHCWKR
jgi:hypothetical protein